MSFGFGVGDFIAVGTLAIQAYTSLQDRTGSAADYMSLKLIRGSFGKALAEAERQITNKSAGPPSKFAADIKKEFQNCSQLLRTFDESVKKFDASLSPAGSGNKVRDTIRKLQWNNVKAGIRELIGGLHRHIGAIQMLWQMHDSHTLALINNQTEAIYAVVQRIEKKVILQSPGWHPDNEPIRFVDALERNINLPWECCRTWQSFCDVLQLAFEGQPGVELVNRGLFRVLNEADASNGAPAMITANSWEDTLEPGMLLSMAMIHRKQADLTTEQECPGCGTLYKGYGKSKDLQRVRCNKCFNWFQISSEPRITPVDDVESGAVSRDTTDNDAQRMHIRRWHVLLDGLDNERDSDEPRTPRWFDVDEMWRSLRE